VGVCHVAVHDWYHRLKHPFEPDRDRHEAVAVDETKLEIEGEEVYVWAAVDVETFEVLHVDASPG
jgi:putative transposase